MTRRLIFLTHADVVIDPATPVPDWGLSERGRTRHEHFARSEAVTRVTAIYSSMERKAREGADITAAHLDLSFQEIWALHENDRSSTGYLPQDQFERTADQFFAAPDTRVEGWESARAAQARVLGALRTISQLDRSGGDILIVGHGGIGTLLRCHTKGTAITRDEDQPANGGGNWFTTSLALDAPASEWRAI